MFVFEKKNFYDLWGIVADVISRAPVVLAHKMAYDTIKPSIVHCDSGKPQDYVRTRSLELVAQEIHTNNVPGNVAEAGVWSGGFAQLINHIFPQRKLYLFDTFEGFSKDQVMKEYEEGLIDKYFTQDGIFANTSVTLVLQNMPHKEVIIPVKGMFEETSRGIDDMFAFVSLDMDLYEPMLAALEYFYPRMSSGGYIFMHDYNHSLIKGVKRAVSQYEKQHACTLCKFPLPDAGGTLVVTKQ